MEAAEKAAKETFLAYQGWEEDLPEILKDPLIQAAFLSSVESSRIFGNLFFPKAFSVEHDLEKQLCQALDSGKQKIVICAPRGMGKTTRVLLGYCARKICWRLAKFMIYTTNTTFNAIIQTESLKNALKSTPQIKEIFGPPQVRDVEGLPEEFRKDGWAAFGTMVVPRGAGQQFRGLLSNFTRPDLFLFDDLEDRETVTSDIQRQKLKAWFYGDVTNCVSRYDKDWTMIYIDTLKHEDSLLKHLLEDPEWHSIHLTAFTEDLQTLEPAYMTNEEILKLYKEHERAGTVTNFFMEFGGILRGSDSDSFTLKDFRYYQADRIEGEIKIFSEAHNEWKRDFANKHLPFLNDPFSTILKMEDFRGLVLGDPAKSKEGGKAESALVGVLYPPDISFFLIHSCWSGNVLPSEFYNKIFEMILELNATFLGVEDTGLADYIRQPIESEILRLSLPITFIPLSASSDKADRVKKLVPWYKQGIIYHRWGQHEKLEKQLLGFPYSKLWDLMDALAHLPQLLLKAGLKGPTPLTSSIPLNQEEMEDIFKDEFFGVPPVEEDYQTFLRIGG